MSASSAAPVSSAETPVKTTMKTVAEAAVKTMNGAAVEPMVKMRKPLRYYDRELCRLYGYLRPGSVKL